MKISRISRSLGEMKIKKVKFDGMDSFNDYQVELSYGQLIAIRDALEAKHDNPLADELYAELNYYLQNIPGPGENSDQFKAERDAATKGPEEAGQELAPEDAGAGGPPQETGLEAGDGAGGALPAPPTDEFGLESSPGPEGEPGMPGEGGPGADFQEGPKLSPEERDIIDRSMQGGPGARPTGVRHGESRIMEIQPTCARCGKHITKCTCEEPEPSRLLPKERRPGIARWLKKVRGQHGSQVPPPPSE